MLNKIVVTSDFESLKAKLESEFGINNLRFFISDDFLLENAKEAIAEAYIAEKDEKILVIHANSFRTEAQNSLLKIIEEPPRNIKFIIATQSKNLLLPTIRSRMLIENNLTKKPKITLDLNLKTLSLKEITSFIDQKIADEQAQKFGKNELKELVGVIVTKAVDSGYKFSGDEMDYFFSLIKLADLNAKSHAVLTPLLLTIFQKGRR
ncbi:DNA polymerase III subunit delta' [Campylobacter concisus]|uniref:DNA polymerase III subunit delta n=1 Tax=Campylobacter concisus TaxID=199 RepID=A0A7S9R726_9BACT|nr:DNA polymerase III subunit delta' [Campylobacter concisus]QPH84779.1 DNA polymerase III subunit delta' [Campylobacter concisus]